MINFYFLFSVVPPTIQIHPLNQTVGEGKHAVLSVQAIGTNPVYQWWKDKVQLSTSDHFPCVTGSHLSITSATSDVSGSYFCVVSNEQGTDSSLEALVTVGKTCFDCSINSLDQHVNIYCLY